MQVTQFYKMHDIFNTENMRAVYRRIQRFNSSGSQINSSL